MKHWREYHDTHCEDKEVLITIRKAIEAGPELRSKKDLIEAFINGINEVDDVMIEWHDYVVQILSAETIVNDNNGNKEYCVSLKFTDEGAEKFAEATEQNIGKVISIYVDDVIVSAPMVQAKITGGEAIISGPTQTYEECQELVEKIYEESKSEESESVERPDLKITENDGTILVTEKEIDTCYCEALDIGKGGSAVDVVIIEFTDGRI